MHHAFTSLPGLGLNFLSLKRNSGRLFQPHTDYRWVESWVEVSSRPSSSSLSSAADEIITDGLRVQHDSNLLRRRRLRRPGGSTLAQGARQPTTGTSSQEEYEESESESDRIMTSSNEAIMPSPLQNEWRPTNAQFTFSSASSENDDDENATAIGVRRGEHCFTPQPNAFSHPPSANRTSNQEQSANSYFAQRPSRPSQRNSYPTREQHSPFNVISPSHQADHDAALRASLSTLLSCAAAARGLPKAKQTTEARTRQVVSNRVDPMSIGLMPESAVYGASAAKQTTETTSRGAEAGSSTPDKAKRKVATATTQRSSSKDRRVTKKVRRTSSNWTPATMEEVNPTLLTWFVGAGVVVLVSALSFSAGYMAGREAGQAEVLELYGGETGSCGKEAMIGAGRGLRRLRWTDAASSIRV
jgi:hypothetical protein